MDLLPQQFRDALARLDAEIDSAERVVVALKLKREGANVFLEYSGLSPVATGVRTESRSAPVAPVSGDSPTALVWSTVQAVDRDSYTLDQITDEVLAAGGQISKDQVRNSVHYLVRRGQMRNLRRGLWAITNAEAPVSPGASDGNTPTSEEGGDSHEPEASKAPPSQAEDLDRPQLGSPIAEIPR